MEQRMTARKEITPKSSEESVSVFLRAHIQKKEQFRNMNEANLLRVMVRRIFTAFVSRGR